MADLNTTINPSGPFGRELVQFLERHGTVDAIAEGTGVPVREIRSRYGVVLTLVQKVSTGQPFEPSIREARLLGLILGGPKAGQHFTRHSGALDRVDQILARHGMHRQAAREITLRSAPLNEAFAFLSETFSHPVDVETYYDTFDADHWRTEIRPHRHRFVRAATAALAAIVGQDTTNFPTADINQLERIRHNTDQLYLISGKVTSISDLVAVIRIVRDLGGDKTIPGHIDGILSLVEYQSRLAEYEVFELPVLIDRAIADHGSLVPATGGPFFPRRHPDVAALRDAILKKMSLAQMDQMLRDVYDRLELTRSESRHGDDRLGTVRHSRVWIAVPGGSEKGALVSFIMVSQLFARWVSFHGHAEGPRSSKNPHSVIPSYARQKDSFWERAPLPDPSREGSSSASEPIGTVSPSQDDQAPIYELDWMTLSDLRMTQALRGSAQPPTVTLVASSDETHRMQVDVEFREGTPRFSNWARVSRDGADPLTEYQVPTREGVPFVRSALAFAGERDLVTDAQSFQARLGLGAALVYDQSYTERDADADFLRRARATLQSSHSRFVGGIDSDGQLQRRYSVAYFRKRVRGGERATSIHPRDLVVHVGNAALRFRVVYEKGKAKFQGHESGLVHIRYQSIQGARSDGVLWGLRTCERGGRQRGIQVLTLPDLGQTQVALRSDGLVRLVPASYTDEQIRAEFGQALQGDDAITVSGLEPPAWVDRLYRRHASGDSLLSEIPARRQTQQPLPYRPIPQHLPHELERVTQKPWFCGVTQVQEIPSPGEGWESQHVEVRPFSSHHYQEIRLSFQVLFDGHGSATIDRDTIRLEHGSLSGARAEVLENGAIRFWYRSSGQLVCRDMILEHDGYQVHQVYVYGTNKMWRSSDGNSATVGIRSLHEDALRPQGKKSIGKNLERSGFDRFLETSRTVPLYADHFILALVQTMPADFSSFVYEMVMDEDTWPVTVGDWEALIERQYSGAAEYNEAYNSFSFRNWRSLDPVEYILYLLSRAVAQARIYAPEDRKQHFRDLFDESQVRAPATARLYREQARAGTAIPSSERSLMMRELRARQTAAQRRRYIEGIRSRATR